MQKNQMSLMKIQFMKGNLAEMFRKRFEFVTQNK